MPPVAFIERQQRYRRGDGTVFLFAFDLLELNGDDLRREPLEVRKATLASVLDKAGSGLRLNEYMEHHDGELVFRHACKRGLEGIVSKCLRSGYRSGLSPDWLKEETCGAPRKAGGGGALGMSYWSTTSTFTLTSDTPAILTIVPETWMVNSS